MSTLDSRGLFVLSSAPYDLQLNGQGIGECMTTIIIVI